MSASASARASAAVRKGTILDRLAERDPLEGCEVERVVDVTPQGNIIVETVLGFFHILSGAEAQRLGFERVSI